MRGALKPNLIARPAPPLEPPLSVPEMLARLRPGTRLRIFWREGGERRATSGTVTALDGERIRLEAADGAVVVARSDVTCLYQIPGSITSK